MTLNLHPKVQQLSRGISTIEVKICAASCNDKVLSLQLVAAGSLALEHPIKRVNIVTRMLNKKGYLYRFKRMSIQVYTHKEYNTIQEIYSKIDDNKKN